MDAVELVNDPYIVNAILVVCFWIIVFMSILGFIILNEDKIEGE